MTAVGEQPLDELAATVRTCARTGSGMIATDTAVIAAMRLAVVGAASDADALAMLRLLLDCAASTSPDDTAGPALLCDLLADRRLSASVTA